jgi:hypothetical protein
MRVAQSAPLLDETKDHPGRGGSPVRKKDEGVVFFVSRLFSAARAPSDRA